MSNLPELSRRQLLGAGLGAASTVLIGSTSLRGESTQLADDLRCGIIGVGGRGSAVLGAINQSPRVRVTAICDIDSSHLNAAAKIVAADKPKLFSDYCALLDFDELDAVFVETPPKLHKEMVIAVLKSGRHCYGEKPMALRVSDLNNMAHVVKSSKGIYQVGTQLRYAAPWKPAIDAVHAGVIGTPIFVRAHRHNSSDYPPNSLWYFHKDESGDCICEQAVHEFDIINAVFQGIPERAAGFGGQAIKFEPAGRDIMDHYSLTFDYGKNKKCAYSHSWIAPPNVPSDGRVEIVYGEKGAIDIEQGIIYPLKGDPQKVDAEPKGDSTQLAVNDFFRCIREGKQPLCNAEAGRNAALTALLGRKAIERGRVVTMKELLLWG